MTTREDHSTVEEDYFNHDFYRKGLPSVTATRDAGKSLFSGQEITYAPPDTTTLSTVRYGSFFPSKSSETTNFYEGQTSDFAQPLKTRTENFRTFDEFGNLIDYEEHFDEGAASDVFYHVDFDPALASRHIFRAREVQAHAGSSSGPLFRDRQATYESHGALATLTNVLSGGKDPATGTPYSGGTNPTWTFQYDSFGNVVEEIDPRNYTLHYTYDQNAQTYRTMIEDSFGYYSMSVPNYAFGVVQATTDVNGNVEPLNYDEFGRLSTVYGPTDVALAGTTSADFCGPTSPAASEPTIVFCYSERGTPQGSPIPSVAPSQPAYALSRHKDVQHPGAHSEGPKPLGASVGTASRPPPTSMRSHWVKLPAGHGRALRFCE
jgi:YD repeat-containing protein